MWKVRHSQQIVFTGESSVFSTKLHNSLLLLITGPSDPMLSSAFTDNYSHMHIMINN